MLRARLCLQCSGIQPCRLRPCFTTPVFMSLAAKSCRSRNGTPAETHLQGERIERAPIFVVPRRLRKKLRDAKDDLIELFDLFFSFYNNRIYFRRVVLVVKLVGHHSCGADRLPVAVRFPAGPRVRLQTVDSPKGNGLGQKNTIYFRRFAVSGFHDSSDP